MHSSDSWVVWFNCIATARLGQGPREAIKAHVCEGGRGGGEGNVPKGSTRGFPIQISLLCGFVRVSAKGLLKVLRMSPRTFLGGFLAGVGAPFRFQKKQQSRLLMSLEGHVKSPGAGGFLRISDPGAGVRRLPWVRSRSQLHRSRRRVLILLEATECLGLLQAVEGTQGACCSLFPDHPDWLRPAGRMFDGERGEDEEDTAKNMFSVLEAWQF